MISASLFTSPTLPPPQEEVEEESQNEGDDYRCAERNEHSQVASFEGKVSRQRPDSDLPKQEENSSNNEQHQPCDNHDLADRLHSFDLRAGDLLQPLSPDAHRQTVSLLFLAGSVE